VPKEKPLTITRRALAIALHLARLVALLACAPSFLIGDAMAQNPMGGIAAEPVSLPDMALGSKNAPVTIVEYSSMTCSHCAVFEQNVFPLLKSRYVDTDRVRFVFREFPLDNKSAGASMVARCIAGDDSGKYFGAVDLMFKQQDQIIARTDDTLKQIAGQYGMSAAAVEDCLRDQALLDKITADRKIANEVIKVDAAPTFSINGEINRGSMTLEQLDGRIRAMTRR
jgi:protein-disulfide isomerase